MRWNSLKPVGAAIGAVAALTLTWVALADFEASEWRYVKSIDLPGGLGEETLVELSPDAKVFANALSGLGDLRIIDGDGVEVPYEFEVSRRINERNRLLVSVRDQGYVSGEYESFVVVLSTEGTLHNQIEFTTSVANFQRTATVEASHDGDTWAQIAQEIVYSFRPEGISVSERDTTITYPESSAPFLRVRIADEDGEEPLDAGTVTVSQVKDVPAQEAVWPVSILGISEDAAMQQTIVDLDLGSDGLPTHQLDLRVGDVNFYRYVRIEVSSDLEKWRTTTTGGAIFAYDTPKFRGQNLSLSYPETNVRYIRLVIGNEDNPPIEVQGAEARGLQRRLLFLAGPAQTYSLYYGNDEAGRPSYDFANVLPYLDSDDPPSVGIGPHAANEQFVVVEPPPPSLSERLPWLFPSAVAAAAVIVAVLLFGVLRHVKKLLPPPPE